MNKSDLLNLWAVLSDLKSVKANVKFSYAVAKNRMNIKSEVEALQEAIRPAPEYIKYDQERIELVKKYADTEDGKPKIINGNYIITEKLHSFEMKVAELKDEHADALKVQDAKAEEFKTLLDEEFEFEPFKVGFDNLPDEIEPEVIETFILTGIMEME